MSLTINHQNPKQNLWALFQNELECLQSCTGTPYVNQGRKRRAADGETLMDGTATRVVQGSVTVRAGNFSITESICEYMHTPLGFEPATFQSLAQFCGPAMIA
jgi:hypothetical protein